MTSWNYRVIKKRGSPGGETTYQIHEVYYRQDGQIDCWTQQPVEPLGVNEAQLRNDIQSFLAAFRQPILEERNINGRSVLVEEQAGRPGSSLVTDYRDRAARASLYLYQMLGNHLLLRQNPALRQAYDRVDKALADLHDLAAGSASAASDAVLANIR